MSPSGETSRQVKERHAVLVVVVRKQGSIPRRFVQGGGTRQEHMRKDEHQEPDSVGQVGQLWELD